MTRFRAAHAAGEDWRRAVESCLAELKNAPGPKNGTQALGFVYMTDVIAEGTVDDLVVQPNLANKEALRAVVFGGQVRA